ncbi:hypothetical protein BpHYR1_019324 [Brachionus plicatilis]|uniref:Uncharacterized protein n=1 Tax=Brachionus plicatilis TaxID=10195 RepID=A0A3M7PP28_BRAPC|nr:hypothetical protein BpHYR1_019324 [Brachionus plicatilis]
MQLPPADNEVDKELEESGLICKPEDLASGVVNIDYSVYQNYFSEDAYMSSKSGSCPMKFHENEKLKKYLSTQFLLLVFLFYHIGVVN